MKRFYAFLVFLSVALYSAYPQNVRQSINELGTVDWTKQILITKSTGLPRPDVPAERRRATALEAARGLAPARLMQTLEQVTFDAQVAIGNILAGKPSLRERLAKLLAGFEITDVQAQLETVQITIQIPLYGKLLDALLPSDFGGGQLLQIQEPLCPICGQPWPPDRPIPPGIKLIYPPGMGAPSEMMRFTGLIVDARGLGLKPALMPRIIRRDGKEIYGKQFISRFYAVEMGLASYYYDLKRARADDRVRDNPLIVRAIGISGENQTDVIISDADARLIHAAASITNFLSKCRVIFIVD